MIRRWVIIIIMLAVLGFEGWVFVNDALLYDPLEGFSTKGASSIVNSTHGGGIVNSWGDEILSGNLFSQDRAFNKPKSDATSQSLPPIALPPPEKPKIDLNGTILNQHNEYVAYIVINKGAMMQVRKGDAVDDLSIIDIRERALDIAWNNEVIKLELKNIMPIKR